MGKIKPESINNKVREFLDLHPESADIDLLMIEFSAKPRASVQRALDRWRSGATKTAPTKPITPPDPSVEIDKSFKKLIAYSKYAQQEGMAIPTTVILSHLDKTDQLKREEEDTFQYAELVDKFEEQVTAFIQTTFTPKQRELIDL